MQLEGELDLGAAGRSGYLVVMVVVLRRRPLVVAVMLMVGVVIIVVGDERAPERAQRRAIVDARLDGVGCQMALVLVQHLLVLAVSSRVVMVVIIVVRNQGASVGCKVAVSGDGVSVAVAVAISVVWVILVILVVVVAVWVACLAAGKLGSWLHRHCCRCMLVLVHRRRNCLALPYQVVVQRPRQRVVVLKVVMMMVAENVHLDWPLASILERLCEWIKFNLKLSDLWVL